MIRACVCVYVCVCVCAQSLSVWFCDPMDHGLPGSSVCKNTGAGCHSLLQHDLSRNHVMPLLKSLQYLPISLREKPQFFRGEVPPAHRYSILLTIYPSLLWSPLCSPQLLPDVPLMSQSSTHYRAFAFAVPSAWDVPPPDIHRLFLSSLRSLSTQMSHHQWDLPWPTSLKQQHCFRVWAHSHSSTFHIFFKKLYWDMTHLLYNSPI